MTLQAIGKAFRVDEKTVKRPAHPPVRAVLAKTRDARCRSRTRERRVSRNARVAKRREAGEAGCWCRRGGVSAIARW